MSSNKIIKELELVSLITDGLGKKIDKNVRFLVAALMANKFYTYGSCSGHSDERTPWVDIYSKEYIEFENNKEVEAIVGLYRKNPEDEKIQKKYTELCQKPIKANVQEGERLQNLLNEFYKNHQTSEESYLICSIQGWEGLGGFRLHPQGDKLSSLKTKPARAVWLKECQSEMNAFAEFLCTKIK